MPLWRELITSNQFQRGNICQVPLKHIKNVLHIELSYRQIYKHVDNKHNTVTEKKSSGIRKLLFICRKKVVTFTV